MMSIRIERMLVSVFLFIPDQKDLLGEKVVASVGIQHDVVFREYCELVVSFDRSVGSIIRLGVVS